MVKRKFIDVKDLLQFAKRKQTNLIIELYYQSFANGSQPLLEILLLLFFFF